MSTRAQIGASAPCVKTRAAAQIVAAVVQLEQRADECFVSLELLKLHANIVLWSTLVGGIKLVEEQIAIHGDNSAQFDAALINIGRFIPVALKWAAEHAKPASTLAS